MSSDTDGHKFGFGTYRSLHELYFCEWMEWSEYSKFMMGSFVTVITTDLISICCL